LSPEWECIRSWPARCCCSGHRWGESCSIRAQLSW
jgi:hypothetical protein